MEILIIGGTGLISTEITNVFAASDHSVTLYNRGRTERAVPSEVAVMRGDRTDYDQFESDMTGLDVEYVIDMYCMQRTDAESVVRAFSGNIEQYIFCSTVDVYAFPLSELPVPEDAVRRESGTGYAAEKAGCERILEEAAADGAFALTSLRPWYTYGEGRDILSAIDGIDVIARLLSGSPIIVHDSGETLWGACHRDDVAHAFVEAVGNETAYNESYNVCGEEWLTWNRYFREAAAGLDAPEPDLRYIPTPVLRAVFPERTRNLERTFQYAQCYDTNKAREDLDFEQTIAWADGIRRVATWLEEQDELAEAPSDAEYDRLVDAWTPIERELPSRLLDS